MRYTRLYADHEGESHFEDIDVRVAPVGFAPPAPPLELSDFTPASRFAFLRTPEGWFGDWHPAPARQFLVVTAGEFEVSVSDGETRRFTLGDVVLLEDLTGRGHRTRVPGGSEACAAVVQL